MAHIVSDPLMLALHAAGLIQEGLEVGGLPLAAGPELHALVENWHTGVVDAGGVGRGVAETLEIDVPNDETRTSSKVDKYSIDTEVISIKVALEAKKLI